jgi:PPP family 3-phenylpropionic acid transporter
MRFTLAFFLIYAAYAAINSYLPILLRFSGHSTPMVGVLMGVLEGAGIAGPFVFSFFADRWGRYKPGLVITHVICLLTLIPLLLFRQPLVAGLLILVLGLGFRSAFPLLDAVATIGAGGTVNYGKIRTAGSLGFVLMMLFLQFTPFLKPDNPVNIVWWMGLSAALSLAAMICIPGRLTRVSSASPPMPGPRRTGSRLWSALLVLGLLIIGFSRLAMASVNSFFSLFLVEYLNWNAVGAMWALASASELPFMYLSWRLINRFGALPLLAFSTAVVSLRLAIYAVFPSHAGVIAAQLLHSVCFGLFHPAAVAFISGNVPPERRALGMALYLSLGTGLPTLLGSILGGFIIGAAGYRALFGIFALFPLVALGIYGFIAAANQNAGKP